MLLCGCIAAACADHSPVSPNIGDRSAVTTVGADGAASAARLPAGGLLGVAAQLIASAGTTPLIAQAVYDHQDYQTNQFGLTGLWANPITGHGWINAYIRGHNYLVSVSWPASTTESSVVTNAIHLALTEASEANQPLVNIDEYTSHASASWYDANAPLTPLERLLVDASCDAFKANVIMTANHWLGVWQPAGSGHSVKMLEAWLRYTNGDTAMVRGHYAMSVDGKVVTGEYSDQGRFLIAPDFGFFLAGRMSAAADSIIARNAASKR